MRPSAIVQHPASNARLLPAQQRDQVTADHDLNILHGGVITARLDARHRQAIRRAGIRREA